MQDSQFFRGIDTITLLSINVRVTELEVQYQGSGFSVQGK